MILCATDTQIHGQVNLIASHTQMSSITTKIEVIQYCALIG